METLLNQPIFAEGNAAILSAGSPTGKPRSEVEHQVIVEVIQSVNITACLDDLLKAIHYSLKKILYADNCFVALTDPATDLMHFEFWIDKFDPVPEPRSSSKGFAGYVMRTGQPLLLTEEFKRDCSQQGIVERSGTASASWLGVPLRTPTQIIGILVVQHYEDRDAYTLRDLEFLASIGGQIALAIERKRGEKALQESEEEYRSIFNNSAMGIFRSTPDGSLIRRNGALAKMLGYDSAEEMLHCNLVRDVYYNPKQRAQLIAKLAPQGCADGVELLWKKKDGSPIWVQLNARAVAGEDGVPLWFDACVQDISKRVQAEQALRDSEQRFSQAFNASPQPMTITTTTEDRYVDVNESFVSLSGYKRDELIGHTAAEIGLLAMPEAKERLLGLLDNTGSSRNVETYLRTKSGELRGLLCSAEIIELAGERFLLTASSDITERKQAEQTILEAKTRALKEYERLVERIATLGQTMGNARDLTMVFRALRDFSIASVPCDGMVISLYEREKGTRRVTYCWADNEELDTSSIVEIPVRDGMTGRAIKLGSVIIENNYQEKMKLSKPVIVGDCLDDRWPQSALSAPMTVMGRTVGCVEIQSYQLDAYREEHVSAMRMAASLAANAVENVTLMQREQAKEEQLRQSQKMEAIGQLAGGVAHDFNNLLTVISGYAELSLRRLNAGDPLHANLEEIGKASSRATSLTRQLLAFSRRQMLQEKVLDLNSVVREMDKMLQRLIGEDIDLVTLLKPGVGQIKADPGQIEQVLMNLVVNARDALPKGGKITIETGNSILDETYARKNAAVQPGHYVRLAVSDNGHGMNSDTQKRVFEPFFTTKAVGKGTGLGLSTVYGIIKQSGGNISVYSEEGKGTTFKIYLPRVDNGIKAEEVLDNPVTMPSGSETVLLVEDEDLLRNLSIEILKECGYVVISAPNGEEGLRICKEFQDRIDLVITDVVMPQMGGRELAEHVALLRPGTNVLYMSGYTDDAIVRHGILEENMPFIQKPFLPDELVLKVQELLGPSKHPSLN